MSLAIIAKLPEVLIDLLISTSRPACRLNVPVPVVVMAASTVISVLAGLVEANFGDVEKAKFESKEEFDKAARLFW